jgi:monoamine oxidase
MVRRNFSESDLNTLLMPQHHTIILGAGMAGLAAARELTASHRVTVLEARDRVGGRVLTKHLEGVPVPVEFGAEFVHGKHPVLWEWLRECGIGVCELAGTQRNLRRGKIAREDAAWEKAHKIFDRMSESREDRSFDQLIAEEFSGPSFDSADWKDAIEVARRYVEGFNAADSARVSVQWLAMDEEGSEEIDGGRQFRTITGYTAFAEALASKVKEAGAEICLGVTAQVIEWQPGSAVVRGVDAQGQSFEVQGDSVIVTLPVGVLHANDGAQGAIRFHPHLPSTEHAIQRLAMGSAVRFLIECREAFWEKSLAGGEGARDLNFLMSNDSRVRVWWTSYPLQSSLLTGWVGGPRAEAFAGRSVEDLEELVRQAFAETFGFSEDVAREMVQRVHFYDWHADPLSRGAYSYVPAGALEAIDLLMQPQAGDTIYFAGEGINRKYNGTVHGAIESGLRAARLVRELR